MNKDNKKEYIIQKMMKQLKIGKKVKKVVLNKEKMINMNMKLVMMNHLAKMNKVNKVLMNRYKKVNNKNNLNSQHKRDNVMKKLYIQKYN